MTEKLARYAINCVWDTAAQRVDWLGLEQLQVDILRSSELTDKQKVSLLKEAIDAHTRRGYFF